MGTGTKTPSEPGAPTVAPAEATWPWALEGFQAGLGLPSSTHPNLPSFSSCSGQPRFRTEGQGEVWLLALRSCRAAVGCTVSHHLSGAQPTGSPHPLSGDSGDCPQQGGHQAPEPSLPSDPTCRWAWTGQLHPGPQQQPARSWALEDPTQWRAAQGLPGQMLGAPPTSTLRGASR